MSRTGTFTLRYAGSPLGGLLLGLMLWPGCRIPDPPVIHDPSRGIIYDTAMEPRLRKAKVHEFDKVFLPYVDTLSEPVAITEWSDKTCRWDVFFATNRGPLEETGAAGTGETGIVAAGTSEAGVENRELDVPRYGRSDVLLPRQQRGTDPKMQAARKFPRIIPVAGRRHSAPEIVAMADSHELSEAEFLDGVIEQLRRSRQQDLLLFVHGFNVSFDAAVIRTAQVALDIPFNGAVVAYCWPSQGGVFNYDEDESINKNSVGPFTQFLKTLRAGVPAETRINIVVHSMGNRIVMESLSQLAEESRDEGQESRDQSGETSPGFRSSPPGKPFANVVLCAPDVGHGDFLQWAPGVVAQSERVTLYANAGDDALIASKGLHGELRAGDAWQPLVVDGIETIDCSRIDLSFMGHSYYGSNIDVLSDQFMLIKENRPADKRPHLARKTTDRGAIYWEFHQTAEANRVAWHFDK